MKPNDSRRKIGIFGSVPVFALPEINSVNELKALVGISSYQGVNDEAFPSIKKLAERIGLSEPATSTAVSGLVRKDLVGRKRNYGKTNTYFLLYETESQSEIKIHNREEKKKARAKRLLENIEIHNQKSQSFESLEHSKASNHESSNSSNHEHSKASNDILKEHLKEQGTITSAPIEKSLPIQLKELALKHNLVPATDLKNERLFQNKLTIEMSLTNEKILEQAHRFFEILKKEPSLNWLQNDAFGFKHLQFNWDKINAWHNKNKPRVVQMIPKGDFVAYSARNTPPTLEELERMCK